MDYAQSCLFVAVAERKLYREAQLWVLELLDGRDHADLYGVRNVSGAVNATDDLCRVIQQDHGDWSRMVPGFGLSVAGDFSADILTLLLMRRKLGKRKPHAKVRIWCGEPKTTNKVVA